MPPASDDATRRPLVADARRAPFCYQTEAALDAIRERFQGTRRTTAIAVYVVLTETANRLGGEKARGGFRASRTSVSKEIGVSVDTFDRYVSELVEIGLVEVERQTVEGVNLPNRWRLTDPQETASPAGGSRTDAARVAAPVRRKDLEELDQEGEQTTSAPHGVPASVQVGGRFLPFDALAQVCAVPVENRARVNEMTRALREIRSYFSAERPELAEIGGEQFERALEGEIVRRSRLYRERWSPGTTLTPPALAKWWHDCSGEERKERFRDVDRI